MKRAFTKLDHKKSYLFSCLLMYDEAQGGQALIKVRLS